MKSSRIFTCCIKSNIFRYWIRISDIHMDVNQILFVPSSKGTPTKEKKRQGHCMNSIVTNSGSFIANVFR